MSSILSRSRHPYIICGLWRLSHCSPSSSQGWLFSFSPYVIRSSVDDGANFVNCAACCKLHGVEGYLHVSCWLSSLIRPVFSCQLLRNRYNVRPRPPWRSFALRKRWHWRNEGIFCFCRRIAADRCTMSVKSNIDTLGQNRPASRPAGIYRYAYSCRGIRFTDGGETPVTITLNKEYGTHSWIFVRLKTDRAGWRIRHLRTGNFWRRRVSTH